MVFEEIIFFILFEESHLKLLILLPYFEIHMLCLWLDDIFNMQLLFRSHFSILLYENILVFHLSFYLFFRIVFYQLFVIFMLFFLVLEISIPDFLSLIELLLEILLIFHIFASCCFLSQVVLGSCIINPILFYYQLEVLHLLPLLFMRLIMPAVFLVEICVYSEVVQPRSELILFMQFNLLTYMFGISFSLSLCFLYHLVLLHYRFLIILCYLLSSWLFQLISQFVFHGGHFLLEMLYSQPLVRPTVFLNGKLTIFRGCICVCVIMIRIKNIIQMRQTFVHEVIRPTAFLTWWWFLAFIIHWCLRLAAFLLFGLELFVLRFHICHILNRDLVN